MAATHRGVRPRFSHRPRRRAYDTDSPRGPSRPTGAFPPPTDHKAAAFWAVAAKAPVPNQRTTCLADTHKHTDTQHTIHRTRTPHHPTPPRLAFNRRRPLTPAVLDQCIYIVVTARTPRRRGALEQRTQAARVSPSRPPASRALASARSRLGHKNGVRTSMAAMPGAELSSAPATAPAPQWHRVLTAVCRVLPPARSWRARGVARPPRAPAASAVSHPPSLPPDPACSLAAARAARAAQQRRHLRVPGARQRARLGCGGAHCRGGVLGSLRRARERREHRGVGRPRVAGGEAEVPRGERALVRQQRSAAAGAWRAERARPRGSRRTRTG